VLELRALALALKLFQGWLLVFRNHPPLSDLQFIKDLCVLFWCSVYKCFMNRATAIYVRVSTLDQKHDSQLKELRDYCALRRWEKPVVYAEKQSGVSTSRPVLERLMNDVRCGKIERVICFKLDRLGRSLSHLALLLDELTRHRVALICTTQGIDTSSDSAVGKLQLGVLMAVAQFERSLIVERVNSGLRAAKARGIQLGRPATINGRAVEVRKLKAKGLGLRAIARQLKMPPSSVHKALSMAA
jgi:DNA invertase Pin-like site-specific DNA recombinase